MNDFFLVSLAFPRSCRYTCIILSIKPIAGGCGDGVNAPEWYRFRSLCVSLFKRSENGGKVRTCICPNLLFPQGCRMPDRAELGCKLPQIGRLRWCQLAHSIDSGFLGATSNQLSLAHVTNHQCSSSLLYNGVNTLFSYRCLHIMAEPGVHT